MSLCSSACHVALGVNSVTIWPVELKVFFFVVLSAQHVPPPHSYMAGFFLIIWSSLS